VAPALFAQNEANGTVLPLVDEVPGEAEDAALLAADVCPVAAIILASE
jgi:ferredoxin